MHFYKPWATLWIERTLLHVGFFRTINHTSWTGLQLIFLTACINLWYTIALTHRNRKAAVLTELSPLFCTYNQIWWCHLSMREKRIEWGGSVWDIPACMAIAFLLAIFASLSFNRTQGGVHEVSWGLSSRHWQDQNLLTFIKVIIYLQITNQGGQQAPDSRSWNLRSVIIRTAAAYILSWVWVSKVQQLAHSFQELALSSRWQFQRF